MARAGRPLAVRAELCPGEKSMHPSAMANSKHFFDCYSAGFAAGSTPKPKVIEIGSRDVNGSLRSNCPQHFDYVGVDFAAGNGVDVILEDPYKLPFDGGSADIVVSSSCFEHSEMFWLVFLEIMRVLKPRGLFYLNVPSNGSFHPDPVDCWRFYPDSGRALVTWGRRNGINAALLESYTNMQVGAFNDFGSEWNDFVAVFLKDEQFVAEFPNRILATKEDFTNGRIYGGNETMKRSHITENIRKLKIINQILDNKMKIM
jgi:SAM-dependent methyltransferase